MASSSEIQGKKIFHTIQYREDVFDFGHGPDKLLDDFVQGFVIDDKALSTVAFRYNGDGS